MEEKRLINVTIAGRKYPVRVGKNNNEEETIRIASKLLNDKFYQYKQRYPQNDDFQLLTMSSLQFVQKLEDIKNKDFIEIKKSLYDIDNLLDDYLDLE
ncbi:MAG: cell division protein ZapA [Bacteroidetes bacterium]|jgi:cell division protein ZapA (FtsZ GTPase activity inhibitor)|nr:cell division protein ZapA [Bacteroidota bacterium]MBT6685711.1 cell division protein ZapA [Bacteroidota bacterium]MBT7143506.1 cell division protein ZapA [Bacteroidota bacterium]MBT7492231.1 cell division protein ZapA [Bacteroidota bacterium]